MNEEENKFNNMMNQNGFTNESMNGNQNNNQFNNMNMMNQNGFSNESMSGNQNNNQFNNMNMMNQNGFLNQPMNDNSTKKKIGGKKNKLLYIIISVVVALVVYFLITNLTGGSSSNDNQFKSLMEQNSYTVEKLSMDSETKKVANSLYEAKNASQTVVFRYVSAKKESYSSSLYSTFKTELATLNTQRLWTSNSCSLLENAQKNKYTLTCKEDFYVTAYNNNAVVFVKVTDLSQESNVNSLLSQLGF